MTEPIEDQLARTPCPSCGELTLRLEVRLRSRPPGTWSLAGQQSKTSAVEWPYAVCSIVGCGFAKAATRADD